MRIQLKPKQLWLILSFMSIFLINNNLFAQLDQEIDILEGVLQKMLKNKKAGYHVGGHVKGLYLKDFGVLFHTQEVSPSQVIYLNSMKKNMKEIQAQKAELAKDLRELKEQRSQVAQEMTAMREQIRSNSTQQIVIHSNIEGDDEDIDKIEHIIITSDHDDPLLSHQITVNEEIVVKEKEAIEHIKKKIASFLQKYAYTLEGLKSNDRVAVMINLDRWHTTDMQDEYLAGWIQYADLQKYKEQKLSADGLKNKVKFKLSADDELSDEIDIMSEILNRSTSKSSNTYLGGNSGLYVNGLGVLFFVDYPYQISWTDNESRNVHVPIMIKTDGANGFIYQTSTGSSNVSSEKTIQDIQDQLFGAVTKYGHTLSLSDDENIFLYVDTDNLYGLQSSGKTIGPILLQLKMKDLKAYQQGGLSAKELKKRFVVKNK